MSIFINKNSRVIVQGMTGSEGTKHTRRMLAAGTVIVGGVTPGKGGQVVDIDGHHQIRVFNTVAEAVAATQADTSVVLCHLSLQRWPLLMQLMQHCLWWLSSLKEFQYTTPPLFCLCAEQGDNSHHRSKLSRCDYTGECNVGIIPADITGTGPIGLVSKSGTLTYQMMFEPSRYWIYYRCWYWRRPHHWRHISIAYVRSKMILTLKRS